MCCYSFPIKCGLTFIAVVSYIDLFVQVYNAIKWHGYKSQISMWNNEPDVVAEMKYYSTVSTLYVILSILSAVSCILWTWWLVKDSPKGR